MNPTAEQRMAEDATGCRENPRGAGPLYADGGEPVSDTQARHLFRAGVVIHAPNAGAGSYRTIIGRLGFKRVSVLDWTSSAGDWTFSVRGGTVFQNNRYPQCGFEYSFARAN